MREWVSQCQGRGEWFGLHQVVMKLLKCYGCCPIFMNYFLPLFFLFSFPTIWTEVRRQWHPTPVLLPGKFHGWRSLVGCSPRGRWATSLSLFTFMHCRRKWQPTQVFLPGESQEQGSLVGCRLWGHRVEHNWRDLAAAAEMIYIH